MKISYIASFAATLLAAPTLGGLVGGKDTIGVQITNDKTGANANQNIPVNQNLYVNEIWAGTEVEKEGCVWATSWMLVRFGQDTTHCKLWNEKLGHHSEINARKTWSWMKDGVVAVCLKDAWICCSNEEGKCE